MKKIYLLLAAVMVAMTSFATPMISKTAKLNANVDLQKASYEAVNAIESGKVQPMRSWTDGDGQVWSSFMVNNGGLWTMVGDGTKTVEDFPAYYVTLVLSTVKADGSGYNNYYQLDLCWPAAVCWYEDEQAAIDALGEENIYNISPLEWYTPETAVFEMIDKGYVNLIGILHPETIGSSCMYNGTDGYTFGETTTLSFDAYDAEIDWLDIILNGTLTGSVTRNVSLNYSGEVTLLGMTYKEHEVEVGEVHIFDCGDIDFDNEWAYVYTEDFEPVRRYHVAFTSSDFAYYNPETETAYNEVYTSDKLPTGPGAYVNEGAEYFAFYGTFFATAGSEKPYGKWTNNTGWLQDENYDILNVPTAYDLILGGYRLDISQQDGTWAVYGDFYRNPAQGTADFVIGDKNVGMQFIWNDAFGDKWTAKYTGDIFFHNNPEDYMPFNMIPAIGDQEFNSVEKVETEKINVKVVGNSIVAPEGAEIYNLNGVRVNANDLQNGLYIVKVGKKAVKVVL